MDKQPTGNGFAAWAQAGDGASIFVDRVGEGPAIVCCNGIGCSTGFWRYIQRYFRTRYTVVTWDYRGHGRSPAPADLGSLTIGRLAEDLRAVMDHQELDQAVLIGHSMGSQLILEFYRRYPDRVAGLVPLLGTYGRPVHTFFDTPVFGRWFPYYYPVLRRNADRVTKLNRIASRSPLAFQFARLTGIVNASLCKAEDMEDYFDHLSKLDMNVFLTLAKDMAEHTTADVLPHIEVPVLVIGGEEDRFTPIWLSEEMHNLIPGSELLIIPGGSHAALVEQPELINLRVEKFIRERVLDHGAGESAESAALGDMSGTRSHKR